jgi:hypothetical protein
MWNLQPSWWELVLPEVCLRLPAELERVDAWLEQEAFFEPFRAHFDARVGRPNVPIETYLRLTFLSSATGWATRRGAGRWPTRSRRGGCAGQVLIHSARVNRRSSACGNGVKVDALGGAYTLRWLFGRLPVAPTSLRRRRDYDLDSINEILSA